MSETETATVLMDFSEAMRAVQDTLAVRREAWPADVSVCLRKDTLVIHIGGEWKHWIITAPDIHARDWTV